VLNSETRNTNYRAWDEYSWFLYISGKQDEAIEANQKAQKAAEERQNGRAVQYLKEIKQHEQQIRNKNWTTGP